MYTCADLRISFEVHKLYQDAVGYFHTAEFFATQHCVAPKIAHLSSAQASITVLQCNWDARQS